MLISKFFISDFSNRKKNRSFSENSFNKIKLVIVCVFLFSIFLIYETNKVNNSSKFEFLNFSWLSIFLCKSGGWRFCSVTGADYNAETNTLAILTYSKIYLIKDIDGDNFLAGEMKSYGLPVVKQREAICFSGKNSLYLTDELKKGLGGGNLYQVKIK